MLTVNNLTISFSGRYLFDSVTFNINPEDRIGLIGRNGTGKSTLLKIIAGQMQPEEGVVSKPNDYEIGYLPQDGVVDSDLNIYDETMSAMSHILDVEEEITELTKELGNRDDYESKEYESILHKLNESNDRLKILGGLSLDAEIEKILLGLGFLRNEFDKMCYEFSGGWQMRIELAKLLLRKPDVLLLDEPTNHLDIESIQWLENYLRAYPGAVVLVSHDKNFLNTVSNRTIEIAAGKIFDMKVSFDEFIQLRAEQRQQELNAYKNQQRQIKETERFIERFRYKNTLATRVQSRIKQLDKLERIELEDEDNTSIALKFPPPPRSGKVVCKAEGLSKSYGNNLVLDKIEFEIGRGERIAFVGKNGEGKSTLSRIIAGKEEHEGRFELGFSVEIGYYAQHQAELLNESDTVFDVIDKAATGEMRKHIRTLLGAFLFSGNDIYKKVKVLSGGEKSRLSLAKMLLQPVNLLILDEPTNHLDMIAKDVLKTALLDFPGTMIIVSHDREFLDGLTERTYHFKDKKVKEYLGGIYDFLNKQELASLQELERNTPKNEAKKSAPGKDKLAREEQKKQQRLENKLNKQIKECEDKISEIETEIEELENLFAEPDFFKDKELSAEKQERFSLLRNELESKMAEWEELHSEQEALIRSFE